MKLIKTKSKLNIKTEIILTQHRRFAGSSTVNSSPVHWNCNWFPFRPALSNCALCPNRSDASSSSRLIDTDDVHAALRPNYSSPCWPRSVSFSRGVRLSHSTFLSFVIVAFSCSLWRLTLTCRHDSSSQGSTTPLRRRRTTVASVTELKPRQPNRIPRRRQAPSRRPVLVPVIAARDLRTVATDVLPAHIDDSKSTKSNRRCAAKGATGY